MGLKDLMRMANQSKEIVLKSINSILKRSNECIDRTLHISVSQKYPQAAILPLPMNIDPAETTRFSPQRSRDISATAIFSHEFNLSKLRNIDITLDNSATIKVEAEMPTTEALTASEDPHVESYDCFGAVSLNSSMQSNVPSPFGGLHKFTHLNMPGGQWSQDSKFMSHNLHSSHYTNLRRESRVSWSNYDQDATIQLKGNATTIITLPLVKFHNFKCLHRHCLLFSMHDNTVRIIRLLSSSNQNHDKINISSDKLTQKEKLQKVFKEYGTTVIVFHIGISLVSLGTFYFLVSSGVDFIPLMEKIGLESTVLSNKVTTGAGSFVIAYAIHKVFAPARISITLGSAPFIVRYLRRKGFLKQSQT